jgi:hypothetical protein
VGDDDGYDGVLLFSLADCTISDSVISGNIARFLVSNATFTFQNCAFDSFGYSGTNGGCFETINCGLNAPVTGFQQACAGVTTVFLPTATATESGTTTQGLGSWAIVGIVVGGVVVVAVTSVSLGIAAIRRHRPSNPRQNESASLATAGVMYEKLIKEVA